MMKQKQSGMAVVFAVLMVTVVFAVSLGLFNITLRQILLSLAARDSRHAFYAADSALNCAKYWDWDQHRAADWSQAKPFGYFYWDENKYKFQPPPTSNNEFNCDGSKVVGNVALDDRGIYTITFKIFFKDEGGGGDQINTPCANVTVAKDSMAGGANGERSALGYNISDPGSLTCPLVSSRTVERAVGSSYGQ